MFSEKETKMNFDAFAQLMLAIVIVVITNRTCDLITARMIVKMMDKYLEIVADLFKKSFSDD
jgi:hypothetical protein